MINGINKIPTITKIPEIPPNPRSDKKAMVKANCDVLKIETMYFEDLTVKALAKTGIEFIIALPVN